MRELQIELFWREIRASCDIEEQFFVHIMSVCQCVVYIHLHTSVNEQKLCKILPVNYTKFALLFTLVAKYGNTKISIYKSCKNLNT